MTRIIVYRPIFSVIRSYLSKLQSVMTTPAKQAKLEVEEEVADETTVSENKVDPEPLRIQERDVGICEYLGSHRGFTAILKQRYSDFVVHEITDAGEVVRLTSLDIPEVPESNEPEIDLSSSLDAEQIKLLTEFRENKSVKGPVEIDVTSLTKEVRTNIHKGIAQNYKNLTTATVDKDDKRFISVKRGKDSKRHKEWPYKGDYTHFTLFMENKGTVDYSILTMHSV